MDTHDYDGKLYKLNIPPIDENEKNIFISNMITNLKNKINPISYSIINEIYLDNNKYDPINKLHINDLLYLCTFRIDNPCFIKLLQEQLIDMKTKGFCIQGRTVRLFQLINSFDSQL